VSAAELGPGGFSDADLAGAIRRALWWMAAMTAVALPVVAWKLGWQSAVLLLVGAAVSGSGLWEWLRLLAAVIARMDGGRPARPMGLVLTGFFLRLGLAIAVLYGSLKFLDGSVFALAAGLGLGVVSLTFEAIRLARAWTV